MSQSATGCIARLTHPYQRRVSNQAEDTEVVAVEEDVGGYHLVWHPTGPWSKFHPHP